MFASSLSHVSPVNSWEVFCGAKFDKKEFKFGTMISMEKIEKQEKS